MLKSFRNMNLFVKSFCMDCGKNLFNYCLGSGDEILELEPMNSYNRLLLHRLADIFGYHSEYIFWHQIFFCVTTWFQVLENMSHWIFFYRVICLSCFLLPTITCLGLPMNQWVKEMIGI